MKRMPVLFVGHGSPMNAIEDNRFTAEWQAMGTRLPRPKAILSVSAHWFTKGSRVMDASEPETIYDMYGFPDALYEIVYNAPGAPELARKTAELAHAEIDNSWGLDHGTWSVLHRIYPEADIPVFQLSVDQDAPFARHFEIGRALRGLRDEGVLIFGTGNVVHNLARVRWDMDGGYSWADEFDGYIKESILKGDHQAVIGYERAGASASYAFTSHDHFAPLLYVLGASDEQDEISVFNDACVLGSISMTGYLLG